MRNEEEREPTVENVRAKEVDHEREPESPRFLNPTHGDYYYKNIKESAKRGSFSFSEDDVRTSWVTVTKIECGLGRTFWQDEEGCPLVPSGYVRAADAVVCIEDLDDRARMIQRSLDRTISNWKRELAARDEEIKSAKAKIEELEGSVERLLAQRKEAELRYRRKIRAAKKG
jgi:hypothetical protein